VSRIEAVTFDVGGTLIVPWPSVGHIYAAGAQSLGLGPFDADELNQSFRRAWKRQTTFDYSKQAWFSVVVATFQDLVPAPQREALFQCLYDRFRRPNAWRVHDDVLPTLAALKAKKIRLAVVSNWDDRLPPLLKALDLERWFEVSAISFQLNAPKPDPRLFRHAAEQLELEPRHLLHVGDSEREDLQGALAAGFQALLLDRAGPSGEGRITKLTDLLEFSL